MTIEEHRDEAKYLARSLQENPGYRIVYDHEATALIALAVEQKDPHLLTLVENQTQQWPEEDDEKGARTYLIQALKTILPQTG